MGTQLTNKNKDMNSTLNLSQKKKKTYQKTRMDTICNLRTILICGGFKT